MLKQLINKLCPHGVEYKRLGDILKRTTGTNITAKRMQQLHIEGGEIRIFGGGRTIVDVNHGDIPERDINRKPSIIVKSRGNIGFEYYEKPFSHKNEFWSYYSENEQINSKFVYYYLVNKTKYFQNIGNTMQMPQISIPVTDNYLIPVPPIEVQNEIVRILDKFTLLKAELEAELEARTVQYHYYRAVLLDLSTSKHARRTRLIDSLIEETCKNEVPFYPLNQLFNIRNGYTPSKSNRMFWENGTIPWFRMEDIRENGGILKDSIQKVTKVAIKGKPFPKDSIIIATSATIGDHALILTESLANQRFTYLYRKEEWKAHLDPYFIYYYCFKLGDWCRNNTNISGFASVNMDGFKRFMFPVPPMQIQKTIVNILDRFEALVQDLQDGLPGEIALRQKQYEYYRDQLLSFKALKSEEKADKTEPAIISRSSYDTI